MTSSNEFRKPKPSEQLKLALKLLTYKGWTKGMYARDAEGRPVLCVSSVESTVACSFCALGAIMHLHQSFTGWSSAEDYLQKALPGWCPSVPEYNDDPRCEFKHVRALYCKAIRLAMADEAAAKQEAAS